jgi:hypothetical protein
MVSSKASSKHGIIQRKAWKGLRENTEWQR